MGSSVGGLPRHFMVAVLTRALLLAALLVILVRLLATTQFYATALVVILCAVLVVADLVRVAAHADRSTQRFLDSIAAGALEAPLPTDSTPGSLIPAFDRARQAR